MSATRTTGFSLKRATIVSFVLHFLAAAAIVVTPQSAARSTGAGDGNSNEAVRVSTITIAFQPHASVAAQHPSAPARTFRAESARTSVTAVAVTKPTRFSRAATSPAHAVAARPLAQRESTRIVADTLVAPNSASNRLDETTLSKTTGDSAAGGGATVAPERPLAMPVVAPVPSPSNASEQAVALAESPARADVPSGGWGQSAKPLVADDDELAKLRASEHVSGTITIAVDDSGRATRVTLPASLASDVREELEKKLLSMHYLPAECNGLRCVGTLQLTL